jgi:hypothetical protein
VVPSSAPPPLNVPTVHNPTGLLQFSEVNRE